MVVAFAGAPTWAQSETVPAQPLLDQTIGSIYGRTQT